MGRSSMFGFPVGGKKQKPERHGPVTTGPTGPPVASASMSKAQRLLGASELNIDAGKSWDDMSNSGASVAALSESTAATHVASGRAGRRRGKTGPQEEDYQRRRREPNQQVPQVPQVPPLPQARWEIESETVPAYLRSGHNARQAVEGEENARDDKSDSSSLRRRKSNSTLKSWYDRAKMPLSISQQTSASAMAKGLPPKANAILDVEGKMGRQPQDRQKEKKRPGRLDMSHLTPSQHHGDRRDAHSPGSRCAQDDDLVSPSAASTYSGSSSLPSPKARRRLMKKPTKERLAELATLQQERLNRQQQPYPSQTKPRMGSHQSNGSSLQSPGDLYDHYEEASFRQVIGPSDDTMEEEKGGQEESRTLDLEHVGDEDTAEMEIPEFPATPGPTPLSVPSHSRRNPNDLNHNPVIRETRPYEYGHGHEQDPHRNGNTVPQPSQNNLGAMMAGSRQRPPDNDYASSLASVSSRHTKTSRASRHTNVSAVDSDRVGRSVLSLSSDSEEDDGADTASRSAQSIVSSQTPASPYSSSASRKMSVNSYSTTSMSVTSRSRRESATSDMTRPGSSKTGGKRASFAPANTYLTIPDKSSTNTHQHPQASKLVSINPRTSSARATPQGQTHPHPHPQAQNQSQGASRQRSAANNPSARVSTMSTSTTNSAPYSLEEAKAVTVQSVASTAQSLASASEASYGSSHNDKERSRPGTSTSAGAAIPAPRKHSMRSSGADQPVPSLSPSAVGSFLNRDSIDTSDGVDPDAWRREGSDPQPLGGENRAQEPQDGPTPVNPRFMAVTRQERMLLAALRSKRAMMKESILAEAEGETDDDDFEAIMLQERSYEGHGNNSSDSRNKAEKSRSRSRSSSNQPRGQRGHKHSSSQATIRGSSQQPPQPEIVVHQALRHQDSGTSNGTVKLDSGKRTLSAHGNHSSSRSSSSSRTKKAESHSGHGQANKSHHDASAHMPPRISTRQNPESGSSSRLQAPLTGHPASRQSTTNAKGEQILLYLDRPRRNITSVDMAEPSPDLSDLDFMSLDDIGFDDDVDNDNDSASASASASLAEEQDVHGYAPGARSFSHPRAYSNPSSPLATNDQRASIMSKELQNAAVSSHAERRASSRMSSRSSMYGNGGPNKARNSTASMSSNATITPARSNSRSSVRSSSAASYYRDETQSRQRMHSRGPADIVEEEEEDYYKEDSGAMGRSHWTQRGKTGYLPQVNELEDMPRPDSPISPRTAPTPQPPPSVAINGKVNADQNRKKAARLSAVGKAPPEVGWWGDDD